MNDRARSIRQTFGVGVGVGYGDRIAFRAEHGVVSIHAVADQREDPALAPFLALLERDIGGLLDGIVPLTPALAARIAAATEGMAVDPDAPIVEAGLL